MSVTASFIADTTSFQSAVEKAVVKLRGFETGASRVEKALGRMGDGFSGRRTIQEANLAVKAIEGIGGASTLTAREQRKLNDTLTEAIAKYRALGQEAPAKMVALAAATERASTQSSIAQRALGGLTGSVATLAAGFGVASVIERTAGALVDLGKEAFDTAGKVVDLSAKTGLSTDTIQRMDYVAGQVGGSLEGLSDASYKLGVRLAGGGSSVKAAVEALGLSFKDLQNASPDEQWERIITALGRIENVTERNRVGNEVFGKSFSNVANVAAEDWGKMASAARVSSEQQLQALDALSDGIGGAWKNIKRDIGGGLADIITGMGIGAGMGASNATAKGLTDIADATGKMSQAFASANPELAGMLTALRANTGELRGSTESITFYQLRLKDAEAAARSLSGAQRDELNAALKLGVESAEDLEERFFGVEGALRVYQDQQTKATKATAEHSKVMTAAKNIAGEYKGALEAIFDDARLQNGIAEMREGLASIAAMDGLDSVWRTDGAGAEFRKNFEERQALVESVMEQAVTTREHIADTMAKINEDKENFDKRMLESHRSVWDDMRDQTVGSLSDMLTGLRGFKEGAIGIWQSLQRSIAGVIDGILDKYLGSLSGMASGGGGGLGAMFGGGRSGGGAVASAAGGLLPSSSNAFGLNGAANGLGRGGGASAWASYGMGALAGGVAGLGAGMQGGKVAGAFSGMLSGAMAGAQTGNPWAIGIGAGVGLVSGLIGGGVYNKNKKEAERSATFAARDEWIREVGGTSRIREALDLEDSTPNEANRQVWNDLMMARDQRSLSIQQVRIKSLLADYDKQQSIAMTPKGYRNGVPFYKNEVWGVKTPHLAVIGDASEPESVLKDSTIKNIAKGGGDASKMLEAMNGIRSDIARMLADLPRAMTLATRTAVATAGR